MPKSLNDILKGVKKSTINKLTTGDVPGVDYADKMKDGRDFVAQHSVEKHEDRVGNDDKVYKGGTKKAEMERHGHEPKPKDVQVYKKNQQVGEETDSFKSGTRSPVEGSIEEAKDQREYGYEGDMAITQLKTICRNSEHLMKMLKPDTDLPEWVQSKITKAEDYISTAHDYLMSEMNEETEQLDELTGRKKKLFGKDPLVAVANRAIDRMKLPPNGTGKLSPEEIASNKKYSEVSRRAFDRMGEEVEKLDEAKCNMTEAGKMCEVHGNKACPKEDNDSAENKEPKYTGKKDKQGKQLITDKKLEEKLTKDMSAGEVIKDFEKSDDPRFKGDSKDKRKKRALAAYYGMQKESLSDQRSSKATASEKAREKIHGALMKAKEKMKEQAAPVETPITFPVTNSREGFRV
jgi:hypothetical protein